MTTTLFHKTAPALCALLLAFQLHAVAQSPTLAPAPTTQPQQRLLAAADLLLPNSDPALTSGHTWLILPTSEAKAELLHLPPRDGSTRSTTGSTRPILPIKLPLAAIAAWDGRAYLIAGSPTATTRGVQSILAYPRITDGSWRYTPQGRLETLDSLPGPSTILSLAGTPLGLALLTQSPTNQNTLRILDPQGWLTLPLPDDALNAQELHLLPDELGITLAYRSPPSPTLSLARATLTRTTQQPTPNNTTQPTPPKAITITPAWSPLPPLQLPPEATNQPINTGEGPSNWSLIRSDNRITLAKSDDKHLYLWRLGSNAPSALPPIPLTDAAFAVLGLSGQHRLTILSATNPAPTDKDSRTPPPPPILTVREVSLATGTIAATQRAHPDSPISRQDLQSLWFILLLIGGTVLVIVVRADTQGPVLLPPNASLATPGRRFVAGVLDLLVAAAIVGLFMGKTPSQVFSAATLATGPITPLLALLAVGCLHTTIAEALTGRTLGKWALGIRLSAVQRTKEGWTPAPPRPRQALTRNLIKWGLPPSSIMMFLDTNFRHPGDILSRTIVVQDNPPPE